MKRVLKFHNYVNMKEVNTLKPINDQKTFVSSGIAPVGVSEFDRRQLVHKEKTGKKSINLKYFGFVFYLTKPFLFFFPFFVILIFLL